MDVLCTFKIKIESQNLDHGCVKDQWPYSNQDQDAKPQSGTSSILQSPKQWLKGHGCSLHLQNQDREPTSEHWCIKDQWTHPIQDQDPKSQSGTSSILQSPKLGLKGHRYSLHLQTQYREPKFGLWGYQRPMTTSKSRSRCQAPIRNLQHPPKLQIRT